ncbi:Hypothetical protein NTJ_02193 [Nesidiocoris tenuis]|uniref:Major facilitator superfamily (MFS) profile domain-containing protein n=1 Tax=Nesidiocoris tenuis TaxID=355587 RepID=A0ABN7AET0_9HEMI|nr:Hypothetical protein NTJ_02193 [Nesidiocoris tenuis]
MSDNASKKSDQPKKQKPDKPQTPSAQTAPSSTRRRKKKRTRKRPKGVKFDLRHMPETSKKLKPPGTQPTSILKQQEPILEPIVEPVVEPIIIVEDVPKDESTGLRCTDKFVIYTLWSSEILFILVHAFTHRFMEDGSRHDYSESEHESHGGFWQGFELMCTTCVTMLLVGLIGDFFGRRFLILLSGLTVFSLSPIVGIVSLHVAGLPVVLMWLTVFWYATVPCRFWLVYHQKFPLPIHDTHITATVNEFFIEIVEWLSVVFVEGSKVNFSYAFRLTVWTLILCAAIGYSVATYSMKNLLNKQPWDVEFVRGVYRTTEVIDSFEKRQAKVSVIVFLLILYSGGIFTVVKEYLAVSILQLSGKVYYPSFGGIVHYRLDLIVSAVTMSAVEVQLSFMKTFRSDLKDLILITIAHAVNIVVLVLLLIAVGKSEIGILTTEELSFGSLEFFYPLHYHPFSLECDGQSIKTTQSTVSGFVLVVDGQRDVVCRGWRSDDDILFSENVTLRENLRTVYLIQKPKLVRVDSFDSWETVTVSNIVLMNSIDFCPAEDEKLDLSNLCSLQSVCLPLRIEMIARSAENETLLSREIHLPRVNKTSDLIALPKSTAEVEMRYNHTVEELRRIMNVRPGKFERPESWPLKNSFTIGPDPSIIVLFFFAFPRIACLPMVSGNYLKSFKPDTELIAPSVLAGIALGVAAVGYIHFMWTQSPVRWRTSIIAVYFVQHFLFTWITRACLHVNVTTATAVLAVQCVSSVAHVSLAFWFRRRQPQVRPEQLKRKGGQRF